MHNLSFLIFYHLLLVVIACAVSRLTLFFGSLRLMFGVFFCRRFVGNSHPRIFGLRAHCDNARRGSLSVYFFGLYSPMEKTYWNVSTMEMCFKKQGKFQLLWRRNLIRNTLIASARMITVNACLIWMLYTKNYASGWCLRKSRASPKKSGQTIRMPAATC